ncbi:LysM peptidoglycan-binding domain-containing protein [Shewanella eurypsychrophilus]|uniref:LysM peptidoglycan-binding domain-containing protein n=1 Tax=Shewanella eurypsychrophilus TaxID=2593656 RepID=A0ABX6V5J6_9GAMM|nr:MULTISPECIES: LysM peptidoglycan-binding domain-containing protein [Shewanella]QFU22608.1 LysM peptidoglycan-binding domain-containing protein [Shewanella sp. YLB-09]QPG57897.1 LysM peptidoglycan-binding domain-containing protein [Shewanella eurypsychrophilus]
MRKNIIVIAGAIALLSGCQSFDTSVTDKQEPSLEPTVATDMKSSPVTPTVKIDVVEVTDVWQRIRLGITFDVPDQKLVNQYRDWYIKHPQHLERVSERAAPFLYLIVEEIEKRGLPIELALLPIVESAFDPFAYSHGAASGLWQFTSPMARHFGLEMNWWYDGRRDVPAATIAALDMMEYLYKKTDGNWLYAIAAYNTGEGRVINAVKRNKRNGKPTDFWSLSLPTETRRYVPQLIALADVIKNSDKYGTKLFPIANKPNIEVIDVGSQIDLALAAGFAGMTTSDLHKLNPGYNRWATAPKGPHNLVLPVERVAEFKVAMADIDVEDRLNWERYQIKSGDSLGLIAQRYRTTPSALRAVNDIKGNTIIAGRHLLIPVAANDPEQYAHTLEQRVKSKQNISRGSEKIDYTVKSGDSFWKIANAHKIKTAQLARWNNMAPKDTLKIGQKLAIWTGSKSNSSVTRKVNYTVRSGDSLARIASKFKVSINDLVRWNALEKTKYIQPGQKLKLYVDVTNSRV